MTYPTKSGTCDLDPQGEEALAPSRTMRPRHHPSRRAQGRAPQDEVGERTNRLIDMAVASISVAETPLVLYALRRADDALILGPRLAEWCGHAPLLEEERAP